MAETLMDVQNALRFVEGCIDRYAEQAWRTAYVMLSNAADADDLLQQAFLVAWRKAEFAPKDNAWPWLAAIIANEAANFRRKRKRRRAPSLDSISEPAMENDPNKNLERIELAALVHVSLAELDEDQRIAIVLTHLGGLSQTEAANALGVPLNTLKARVRRGLDSLRDALGRTAPNLENTLKTLPVAPPIGGLIAAKAAWTANLAGNVAVAGTATVATAGGFKALLATAAAIVIVASGIVGAIVASPDDRPAPQVAQEFRDEPVMPKNQPKRLERPAANMLAPIPDPVLPPGSERKPVPTPDPEPEQVMPKPAPEPEWRLSAPEPEPTTEQPTISPTYDYEAVAGISGNVSSVGSDTLSNLMTLWVEGFREHYPTVTFTVESKGSSTGPVALTDGTAHLAPMSREMKQVEIDKFESKYGYRPSYIVVAIDALAVFVNKDNPIESLTLTQLDAIFSSTRKGGGQSDITTWGQAGLTGEGENATIVPYGRNSTSSSYGFFKQEALFKGDFKKTLKKQAGASALVQAMSIDRNAIGYSGIGAGTEGVRAVPLSKKDGEKAYEATGENCYSGDYPLSRYLYIYFNRPPEQDVALVVKEFLRFIHCKEGQEIVEKDGFIPLKQGKAADADE